MQVKIQGCITRKPYMVTLFSSCRVALGITWPEYRMLIVENLFLQPVKPAAAWFSVVG